MPLSRVRVAVGNILRFVGDLLRFVAGTLRSRAQLSAENLFLRKQLALYMERQVKPCRATDATRFTLVAPVVADRLAASAHGRETRHDDPLASPRLSAVVAVEIAPPWPPSTASRPPMPDR